MPFANKFRAMMDLPFAGDTVGGYVVETVEVGHERAGPGLYSYAVRIVLRGAGGQQGVRRALEALLLSHRMTFSGYGNPYQLWFGRPKIESLGEQRYAVSPGGPERAYSSSRNWTASWVTSQRTASWWPDATMQSGRRWCRGIWNGIEPRSGARWTAICGDCAELRGPVAEEHENRKSPDRLGWKPYP